VKQRRAVESGPHVVSEIDDLETETAQKPRCSAGRGEPNLVPERKELPCQVARPEGVIRIAVGNTVENPHANQSYVHPGRIFPLLALLVISAGGAARCSPRSA
jgi:hypothetical protein